MFEMLKGFAKNKHIRANPKSLASGLKPKREKKKRVDKEAEWAILDQASARIKATELASKHYATITRRNARFFV